MSNLGNKSLEKAGIDYLYYLSGKLSSAVSFGEIGKSFKLKRLKKETGAGAYTVNDFRTELEVMLVNGAFMETLAANPALVENVIAISDEVSKKQKVPIDFIREMIEFNSRTSTSRYKISLVGNFENATEEAQNSSLKLFEEPPASSLILLTASTTATILPTILSRSILVHFHPLSVEIIKDIFGLDKKTAVRSTIELMEDKVYHYSDKRRERVLYFFQKIAPRVQHETELFGFIDEIASADNNKLSFHFLEELIEFFRMAHLKRQAYLRNMDLNTYIDSGYDAVINPIVHQAVTSELREFGTECGELLKRVKYNYITEAMVFPSLLIRVSRWYQKASIKR